MPFAKGDMDDLEKHEHMDAGEITRLFSSTSDEMKDAERASAYAAGETVDHVPYSLLGNEDAFAHMFGYTTAQLRDDPQVHIDVIRRRRDEFGMSGIGAALSLRSVGQAVGSRLYYPEIGTDRVEKHAISSLDELGDILDVDPYSSPVYKKVIERGLILKDAFPDMGVGTSVAGPLSAAANIIPIEKLLRGTVKHPDEVRELLDFAEYQSTAFIKMFTREFGPGGCMVCDPVACAGILSRKQFLEFAKPPLERLIANITEITGLVPSLHICGRTSPLWDDMLDMKISAFSVDNCESLEEAKVRMGCKFPLMGNVSPVEAMLNGTVEEVVEAVKDCLRQGSESEHGYTLDTGCQVPIGTPRENVQAYIYAARTYGRGAKLGCLPEGMREA